ncbi:MAG: VOC family protein [Pseudomonadota bacterium]
MLGKILRRSHGFQVDHIGLGVPDTAEGVAWVREQTGASVWLREPRPDQWYWSGALPIGEKSFLEIIGPNPDWRRFHPFKAVLGELTAPTLLFWYVAVDDFERFSRRALKGGIAIENVEAVNVDGRASARAGYRRGYVGPGFMTERPNVIEWVRHPILGGEGEQAGQCRLVGFSLTNPKAEQLNRAFAHLGIDVRVAEGPSCIAVEIDTPRGQWRIENAGISLVMPSMLWTLLGLWWRSLGRGSSRRASNQRT